MPVKKFPLPPKRSRKDDGYLAGQAGTSVVGLLATAAVGMPFLGGLFGAAYSKILVPPLTKRTQEWMKIIYEGLLDLEMDIEGFTLESLSKKPLFTTTFLHCYTIALRTHHEEKLEALRNVVINAAKPTNVEDDVLLVFTNFIDTFTRWHIKILEYLENVDQVSDFKTTGRAFSSHALDSILDNFSELKEDGTFTAQVIKDLQDHGLIKSDSDPDLIVSERSEESTSISNTTTFGKRFLKIIHS